MANNALIQIRVAEEDKQRAGEILEKLGTNISAVVNMLLKQIILTEGIPFEISLHTEHDDANQKNPAVALPKALQAVNADLMSSEEIHAKIQEGYDDTTEGRIEDADSAFSKFRENR